MFDSYQFHVTDTHLFMPLKSLDWFPTKGSDVTLKVIDIYTGQVSNAILANNKGYDPVLGRRDYPRIDAVTAPANHWDNEKIYTLNDRQEVGIYTLSRGRPVAAPMLFKELTKSSSNVIRRSRT